MIIKFVPRSKVRPTKNRASKFKPLIDALGKLKPDGDAIEVKYSNDKELLSMRTTVYLYQRSNSLNIKTRKDQSGGKVYFFRNK